jgi:hypothetical protein
MANAVYNHELRITNYELRSPIAYFGPKPIVPA